MTHAMTLWQSVLYQTRKLYQARPRVRDIIFGTVLLLAIGLYAISKSFKDEVPLRILTNVERIQTIANSCGALCNPEIQTTATALGLNTTYRKVPLSPSRCRALYSNGYMFASAGLSKAPRTIPDELVMNFSMNGRIAQRDLYLNSVYLGNKARKLIWTPEMISKDTAQLLNSKLRGTYGYAATTDLFNLFRHIDVRNARVLVIGSELPWVEVAALAAGARETVTLEFSEIETQDPRMSAYTPKEFGRNFLAGKITPFDVVASYSSLEHSGLGRYGDALNPWGDVVALAMAWCVAQPQAKLVLEVPRDTSDVLFFNAHRFYGPERLPFLTTNWAQMVPDEAWGSTRSRLGIFARPMAYRRMD